MDQINIRKATLNDLRELYQFEQGVISAERFFDPTLKEEPVVYYEMTDLVTAPHIHLVVAESGDKIVGSGYARIETSKGWLKHKKHAYLGFMYVLPDFRGQGINQKIINVLKQWASSRNVKELRLDVYFNNTAAINAYMKIGFSKHMLEMRLNLEED